MMIKRILVPALLLLTLALTACGPAATPVPITAPTTAPAIVPDTATPAPSAQGQTVPTPKAAATVPPIPATAPVQASREVLLAVSRNLANGEEDPYYTHNSLMVWDSLVMLNEELEPTPQLSESWTLADDQLSWTFELREGISYTDGTPFNADAVVANIDRLMQISPRRSPFFSLTIARAYGDLAGASKSAEGAVEFRLNSPNPSMIFTMSNFFSAMFSPDSFAENGDFTGIPATTGRFKLAEWERDRFVLLERNEDYWDTKPLVQWIRLRVIPDSGARVSAIAAGEVDGVVELGALSPAEAKSLEGREGITVGGDPVSISQYLFFGNDRPPFDNVELRRAVSLAIDREAIVEKLALGYGVPGKSLLSAFVPRWLSPKGEPMYDPAQARRLARTALGEGRASATLIFRTGSGQAQPYKSIAELLQAELGEIGIDLELVPLEPAAARERRDTRDWNLRIGQTGWANGDPDFILGRFLASDGFNNATIKGGYSNPEADRLIALGKAELDPQKRFEIYERLQEIAADEVPVTPLYHNYLTYAYRDTITGLRHRVTYQPTLDTIQIVK